MVTIPQKKGHGSTNLHVETLCFAESGKCVACLVGIRASTFPNPNPQEDQTSRSTLGFYDLHHRSMRGSTFWILPGA